MRDRATLAGLRRRVLQLTGRASAGAQGQATNGSASSSTRTGGLTEATLALKIRPPSRGLRCDGGLHWSARRWPLAPAMLGGARRGRFVGSGRAAASGRGPRGPLRFDGSRCSPAGAGPLGATRQKRQLFRVAFRRGPPCDKGGIPLAEARTLPDYDPPSSSFSALAYSPGPGNPWSSLQRRALRPCGDIPRQPWLSPATWAVTAGIGLGSDRAGGAGPEGRAGDAGRGGRLCPLALPWRLARAGAVASGPAAAADRLFGRRARFSFCCTPRPT